VADGSADGSADGGAGGAAVLAGVRERLADDLDAPGAIAVVDDWAAAVSAGTVTTGGPLVRDVVDALLGVMLEAGR